MTNPVLQTLSNQQALKSFLEEMLLRDLAKAKAPLQFFGLISFASLANNRRAVDIRILRSFVATT
jgi:hypothetical protein